MWNEGFHEFAERHGMKRSGNDFCVYIGDEVWLLSWVDDIIVVAPNTAKIIEEMEKEFTTKNLGQNINREDAKGMQDDRFHTSSNSNGN
ncbi:hypothetical protein QE152_g11293 [Popillia japonica]|uniref:Reverse transcriptase n=1 Tax=Popillia japonica TaxID=7064 RepID=A0AAW1LSC3_POPJA